MNTGQESVVRVGAFELDLRARELRQGKSRVRLQDQPFEILQMLLERRGHVVTRDELRQRLWPAGTFVDFEHSLNAAVKRLRAALGDDADNPRFVETLPRRGYRFIGDQEDPPALEAAAAQRVRLAVLPFTDLGGVEGEYFGDGLTEEMISQLGRICRHRLGVLSLYSSMAFRGTAAPAREIGRSLRADYLLEGSVRRVGDRVRISARLVETATETHLWVETYERHLTDCLSVQTDVAARIAHSLAMELAPEPPLAITSPSSTAAYQAYLKGRYYWHKTADTGVNEALGFYRAALEQDPDFAAAHAGVARAHVMRAQCYHERPRRALEQAREAVERALQLDPAQAEAHLALADVRRMLLWDVRAARAAYARAIELNPSYESAHRSFATMLATLRRFAQALREADRACALDPLCLDVNTGAAWVRYVSGDYDGAADLCRHTVEMDEGYVGAQRLLGASLLAAGQRKEALRVLEQLAATDHPDLVAIAWLGHARAVTGDRNGAEEAIGRLAAAAAGRYVPPFHVALAHVGLGNLEAAFQALDQAAEDRDPALATVAVDPRFEPLRGHPRYLALVSPLGL
jgi:TolB-like protein/tetratricopeptide (TPR) repeat protein